MKKGDDSAPPQQHREEPETIEGLCMELISGLNKSSDQSWMNAGTVVPKPSALVDPHPEKSMADVLDDFDDMMDALLAAKGESSGQPQVGAAKPDPLEALVTQAARSLRSCSAEEVSRMNFDRPSAMPTIPGGPSEAELREWEIPCEPTAEPPFIPRDDVRQAVGTYLRGCLRHPHSPSLLFVLAGGPGMGKTRALSEICSKWAGEVLSGEGVTARGVVVGDVGVEGCMAHRLCAALCVPGEVPTLHHVVALVRAKLGVGCSGVLVLGIDGVADCGAVREALLLQDETLRRGRDRVVFLFSSRGEHWPGDIGRGVHRIALRHLPAPEVRRVVADQHRDMGDVGPVGLLCMGHPGAWFSGISRVLSEGAPLEVATVVDRSGLSGATLQKSVVLRWVAGGEFEEEELEDLRSTGVLHRGADGRDCLFPLLLRHWAAKAKEYIKLAHALDLVYSRDTASLHTLLPYLEAVRRIAIDECEVALEDYYEYAAVCRTLRSKLLSIRAPASWNAVDTIESCDVGALLCLRKIVVTGQTFLIPFEENGKPVIAVHNPCTEVTDMLEEHNVAYFPVLYSEAPSTGAVTISQSALARSLSRIGLVLER